ncbi:MAG TPA: tetratricopeptide repeat protein [Tepidisphaeraceae bacterium]|jgi:tetratricopeptide (TPR) repeat protein|nr:tetratricopeptide repeat protein [Tepidisphaeraceae bacterium]
MAKRVNTPFISVVGGVCFLAAVVILAGPWLKAHIHTTPIAQQVKTLTDQADQDVKEGRFPDAKEAITNASRLDPNNKELLIKVGDITAMLTAEDGPVALEHARTQWENALEIDPSYKPALDRLLSSYIEQLEVHPSADICLRLRDAATRSFEIDPKNMQAKAYISIATVQQWVEGMHSVKVDFTRALEQLAVLQKENPTSPDVLFYLIRGRTFGAWDDFKTGRADTATQTVNDCRTLLDGLAAKYPKDAALNFRIFQGYVFLMDTGAKMLSNREGTDDAQLAEHIKKDHASADAALVRTRANAKPQDPKYEDYQFVASDWSRRNGHIDESEKILRDFYKLRKDDQRVRLALCRVLSLTGDPAKRDEAIAILKLPIVGGGGTGAKVVGMKELDAQTLLDLTSLRVALYPTVAPEKRAALMGEIDAGYEKIQRVAITDSIPKLRLEGLIAQLKGRNVAAVAALSRAMVLLEHADTNNPIKYDLMYQLATADRLAQQNHAAEKYLTQIVERFEGYTPARMQLADLYLEENNLAEAGRQIDFLSKQKPSAPEVIRLEIMLNQRAGKDHEAKALVALLPETRFEEKLAKAQLAANLQDWATAIRLLESMQKDRPDDTGIIVALCQADSKGTAADQANGKKVLADALKLHPNDPRLQLVNKQEHGATAEEIQHLIDSVLATKDPFSAAIREAREALGAGKMDEALAHTREADQIHRNDPASWDLFFNIYMQQRNWEMADRAVENLARLNADQASGKMYRWKYSMGRQQFTDAIATARDLTVSHDSFGQSWLLLAQALQANGQFNEALTNYQAALERQTTNIDAYKGMADCYEALSQPDRAYETINVGRRLFPDNVYLRERAMKYLYDTNPVALVAERQKLLDANPGEPENYILLSSACVAAGQSVYSRNPRQANAYTDESRDVLTKGVGKFPDHLRLNAALAEGLQNSGNPVAAVKILTDLIASPKWKDKPEPLLLLGEFYARNRKQFADADKAFREAWARTGNKDIDIELRIVALLEEQKDPKDAKRYYNECLAVLKNNAADPRVSRQTLQVHIAAGDTAEAVEGLNKQLAATPKDVNLLNLLAVVNIDGGRFDEARKVLENALTIEPRNNVSLYYRALAELRDPNGNLELALHNLAIVVNKDPRNVQFRLESAAAKLRVRDTEGAATDLEEALHWEPLNRDARLRLLDLYTQTKKWVKFETIVTYAELNPILSDGIWFRAHAYALAAQSRFPEALQKIHEAIGIDPHNAIFARDYLIILLQSKDNAGVLRETEKLVTSGHTEWWVHHLRGLARFATSDRVDALAELDKAMAAADEARDPDAYQQVLNSMADISIDEALARLAPRIAQNDRWRLQSVQLRTRKFDWAGALAELEPLLKKRDKLPRDEHLEVLHLAADCTQSTNALQESKKYYLEWLKIAPNDTVALNNFAYLLAENLNDPQSAKKYSQQAYDNGRRLNSIDPLISDTHGWVLILCGGNDANLGLTILDSLVQGHSDFIDARYHLAVGYLKRNRPGDALQQLNAANDQIKAMEANHQVVRPAVKENIQKALQQATAASQSSR